LWVLCLTSLIVNIGDALNQEKSAAVFGRSAERIAILPHSRCPPTRSRQAALRERITKKVVWRAVDVNRPVMARLKVPCTLQCFVCRTAAFPRPLHLRRRCVSGLKGQLYQPGMKCQVSRPQGVVALQGQFSAGPCRVMAGPRGEPRGGTLAGLMVLERAFVAAAHGPVSTQTSTRSRQ
jgi:hypothetical protein